MWKFILLSFVATAAMGIKTVPMPKEYTKMTPEHCDELCIYLNAVTMYHPNNRTCTCFLKTINEKEPRQIELFDDGPESHSIHRITVRSANEMSRHNSDNIVGDRRHRPMLSPLIPKKLPVRPLVPIKPFEYDAIKAANIRKNLKDLSIHKSNARAAAERIDGMRKTLNHFSKKLTPKHQPRAQLIDLKTSPIKKQIRMRSRMAPAIKIAPHTKLLGSTQDKNTDTSNVKQKKNKSKQSRENVDENNDDFSEHSYSNSGIITQPKNLIDE